MSGVSHNCTADPYDVGLDQSMLESAVLGGVNQGMTLDINRDTMIEKSQGELSCTDLPWC